MTSPRFPVMTSTRFRVMTVAAWICLKYLAGVAEANTTPTFFNSSWNANSTLTVASITSNVSQGSVVSLSYNSTLTENSTTTAAFRTTPRARFCYQCSATSADEPCVTDTAAMANMSTRDPFIKDCYDSNNDWNICMLVTVEIGGKITLYLRDCHQFNQPLAKNLNSDRFTSLTSANNRTTCDLVENSVVCYRPCSTDLCNGPKMWPVLEDPCAPYKDDYYSAPENLSCSASPIFVRGDQFFLGPLMCLVTWLVILLLPSMGCLNS